MEHICIICKNGIAVDCTEWTKIGVKGSIGINSASLTRGDTEKIKAVSGDIVHDVCRREYIHKRKINEDNEGKRKEWMDKIHASKTTTRSKTSSFNFSDCCIFCSTKIDISKRHRKGYDFFPVRTGADDFDKTLKDACESRNDDWAVNVYRRICLASDLHSADALYHQVCSVNFRTGKEVPSRFASEMFDEPLLKKSKAGRPPDEIKYEAFLKTMSYLEDNDEEQLTLNTLVEVMKSYIEDDECNPYGKGQMKQKIIEHFDDDVVVMKMLDNNNVVTLRRQASTILQEHYRNRKNSSPEEEKRQLICTAAKLIQSDIKELEIDKCNYNIQNELSQQSSEESFIPESLQNFLTNLFVGKDINTKIDSIGQAIVQAVRPRALIPPIQLGLAVQLHHHYGSRYLIDTLNALGFCSSYSEVQMFERSAAVRNENDISGLTPEHKVIQYIADNADHDTCTIDGRNTFHGMGIVAAITPAISAKRDPIPRVKVTSDDIVTCGQIKVVYCVTDVNVLRNVKFEKLSKLLLTDNDANLDTLWLSSWYLKQPRPGWNGTMQTIMTGEYPGKSSVVFLPMIDLSSSDETCVLTTLTFVSTQARRYGVSPVVTFDQPLWWKAMRILASVGKESSLSNLVLKLGGFHTLMSYVGCIGHIMDGSGLRELMEQIYASNTVPHLLSGKAISRAIRAHNIIDSALHVILLQELNGIGIRKDSVAQFSIEEDELQELKTLYTEVMCGEVNHTDASAATVLNKLVSIVHEMKAEHSHSRTSTLWIQYMEMTSLMRKFIRAERTGNWKLHLLSLSEMLPYFAACGHNNYTKSCHIYLQQMHELQFSNPTVFSSFEEGLHVIRRSDRFWAGLSADLVIEQELMRSLKTAGGLTRGRGFSEVQRLLWVMSRPTVLEVNVLMENKTKVQYATSDQHKESTEARQVRDCQDVQKLIDFLNDASPFSGNQQLRSITTGMVASDNVNADRAKDIGQKILDKMIGRNIIEISFKRKDKIVQLSTKQSPGGDIKRMDSSILFQRLILLATNGSLSTSECFKYELCSYPASLFDSSFIPLKPNKPDLLKAINKICSSQSYACQVPRPITDCVFVLDGGALVHRIPWQIGDKYCDIIERYITYVEKRYLGASVVFDGYENGPSTKDLTHITRSRAVGREILFKTDMHLTVKKDEFLSCASNKQRFIYELSKVLQQKHFNVIHASGDADVLIVKTAVRLSEDHVTVLVGDDTDLFVLLCYHALPSNKQLYFSPEPKKGGTAMAWDINNVKLAIGDEVSKVLPVAHAMLGCDTTSRVYGLGKGLSISKLVERRNYRTEATVFLRPDAHHSDITEAGERAMGILYNAPEGMTLDEYRFKIFSEKVATVGTAVKPEQLPMTSAAMKYHSWRVYHQVQIWTEGVNSPINAVEWGWKNCDGALYPIMTDLPPAPKQLLQIVKCACKGRCDSTKCTCKHNGLPCTIVCKICKGSDCSNVNEEDCDQVLDYDTE